MNTTQRFKPAKNAFLTIFILAAAFDNIDDVYRKVMVAIDNLGAGLNLTASMSPLPSSTAATIEAKLSSVMTISETSFVTSVLVMPIATNKEGLPASSFTTDQ